MCQIDSLFSPVRIDYCNSILYGLPDNSLYRLQKIKNSAAIIVAHLPRRPHCLTYTGCQLGTESRIKFVL